VAGRLAAGTSFLTVARGANAGKEFLSATYPAEERARRGQDLIQDTSVVLFIGGLLGARITYLLKDPQINSVWKFLLALPMIWEGGIIFYGSVIGGIVVYAGWYLYLWYFRNIRIDTLKLVDIAAPALALGLCLGRIGCLLNGCCYGQVACSTCAVTPVHFPLSAPSRYPLVSSGFQTAAGFTFSKTQSPHTDGAIVGDVQPHSAAAVAGLRPNDVIVAANGKAVEAPADLDDLLSIDNWPRGGRELTLVVRDPQKGEQTLSFTPYTIGLYPTQVYESVSMFILFWVLLAFFPIRMADGQVMALMMMCYAVHRWLNEMLRNDPRPEGFESQSSIGLLAAGLAFFVWLYFRQKGVRKA
jgi:prolipoprotein diacylglyceryltransferase